MSVGSYVIGMIVGAFGGMFLMLAAHNGQFLFLAVVGGVLCVLSVLVVAET